MKNALVCYINIKSAEKKFKHILVTDTLSLVLFENADLATLQKDSSSDKFK